MEHKIPREIEIARNAITSRIENLEVGICPVCKDTMIDTSVLIQGVPCEAIACLKDKVVMPKADT